MSDGITVYGTTWCFDTVRSRRLLESHGIEYAWYDIDKDEEAAEYVKSVNHGNRSVPTIVFPDGSILVEPGNNELEQKLSKI